MGEAAPWRTRRHTPKRNADTVRAYEVTRAAVQANIGELRMALRAGAGLLWCCLGGLAAYPQPCPFGHADPLGP
jgi:hypothetical protein